MVFGAALGEMLIPVFVGHTIVDPKYGPDALLDIGMREIVYKNTELLDRVAMCGVF